MAIKCLSMHILYIKCPCVHILYQVSVLYINLCACVRVCVRVCACMCVYCRADWIKAVEMLNKCLDLCPEDGPSLAILHAIESLSQVPYCRMCSLSIEYALLRRWSLPRHFARHWNIVSAWPYCISTCILRQWFLVPGSCHIDTSINSVASMTLRLLVPDICHNDTIVSLPHNA